MNFNDKHFDAKGKEIHIGDVVIIKDNTWLGCGEPDCSFCERQKKTPVGILGIVEDFGCIQVEISDFSSRGLKVTEIVTLEDDDVIVVGDVRE